VDNTHRILFPILFTLLGCFIGVQWERASVCGPIASQEVERLGVVLAPESYQVPASEQFLAEPARCLSADTEIPRTPFSVLRFNVPELLPLAPVPEKTEPLIIEDAVKVAPYATVKSAVQALAMNVYWEGHYEPTNGQVMITNVVMNRAEWNISKVEQVILHPKQFSWTHERNKRTGKMKRAELARYIALGTLPPEAQEHVGVVLATLRPFVPEINLYNIERLIDDLMAMPFYDADHYQTYPQQSKVWQCYEEGDSVVQVKKSGHIACSAKDVVKPGKVPGYIKERKKGVKE
jgi:hypothetical protein